MPETRSPGLRSPTVRRLLALDLEGIPPELASTDNTYMLSIVAAVWLDSDDRLAARRREEAGHGHAV